MGDEGKPNIKSIKLPRDYMLKSRALQSRHCFVAGSFYLVFFFQRPFLDSKAQRAL